MAVAAFFAGFAALSASMGYFLPTPELPHVVREKVAYLSEHGNEYDAIFLGSSRIQNHVMAERFDQYAAAMGRPMKSFNFGISAMHSPEDQFVLDRILAQPHAKLRWVFVEIDFLETSVRTDESGTLRGLYWHDWPRFRLLCQALAVAREKGVKRNIRDAFERWGDFLDHGRLFCQRASNTGRGENSLARWLFRIPPPSMDWECLGKARDGWMPAIEAARDIQDQRSGRLRTILNERIVAPPSKDIADAGSQDVLACLLGKIVRAGAQPIIVIPPRSRESYYYPRPDIAARFPVIDLCDPARYPDLYREDLRVNLSHFNAAGAEVFTHILAEQFVEKTQSL
jgi:hypothetical protein